MNYSPSIKLSFDEIHDISGIEIAQLSNTNFQFKVE